VQLDEREGGAPILETRGARGGLRPGGQPKEEERGRKRRSEKKKEKREKEKEKREKEIRKMKIREEK
jgi:hypothetical protein